MLILIIILTIVIIGLGACQAANVPFATSSRKERYTEESCRKYYRRAGIGEMTFGLGIIIMFIAPAQIFKYVGLIIMVGGAVMTLIASKSLKKK